MGNNNSISDNNNIQNTHNSFTFVHEVNFISRKGRIIYAILMISLYLIWFFCILHLNAISYILAMTLIPILFFAFGRKYLKQRKDEKHLKIHKALMILIVSSIMLFFIAAICSPLIGASVITIGCILMALNLLTSNALFANALDGDKIVDFVMGIFIKFS